MDLDVLQQTLNCLQSQLTAVMDQMGCACGLNQN